MDGPGGGRQGATVVDGWWPSRPWQSGRRLKTHKQDQLRYPILDVLKRKKNHRVLGACESSMTEAVAVTVAAASEPAAAKRDSLCERQLSHEESPYGFHDFQAH